MTAEVGLTPVDVSVESITRMLRAEGLEPHPMLVAAIGWLNPDENAHAEQQARDEFASLGLLGRRGLSGEALDWLACLSRATVEYLAVSTEGDTTSNILVAGIGREAVVAHRIRSLVRLQRIDNVYLPETFLRQLPHMPPARGSVTLRISDLQPQQQQTDSIMQPGLVADPPAVSTLKRLTADQAIRNAELYVGVRDHMVSFPSNRGGFSYAAAGWSAVIFS